MKVLVTGAAGFVGRNLCHALKNIRDGKDRTRDIVIDEVFEYDLGSSDEQLDNYCRGADFVFNLAGVNRPREQSEFKAGNVDFAARLLGNLEQYGNHCPVMLSSSIQATLIGRYGQSEYGHSKLDGEQLFFDYSARTGNDVLVYRFPNLFGKWCRPNYNSVIATFCYNIARDLPIQINDPSAELELLYIDDLVEEMISALAGNPHRCDYDGLVPMMSDSGRFCIVPATHRVTLGRIAELLHNFREQPDTLLVPTIPDGSFEKKLYSTYLSYLPPERICFSPETKSDNRGSFTELLKTDGHGQFSVNVSLPGITKGQHWHNSKWELFIVVSGRALIRERAIDSGEVLEFEVSGDDIKAVHMLPGYTHSIINLSGTEKLVTLMWANECFDPDRPDTFFEPV